MITLDRIEAKLDAISESQGKLLAAIDAQNESDIDRWEWLRACLQLMADDNKAKIEGVAQEIGELRKSMENELYGAVERIMALEVESLAKPPRKKATRRKR